ncbi:alpha/beta fold hydrolase [Streptomyces sp. NPDC054783]
MTQLSIATVAGTFDAIVAGPPGGRPVLLLHGFPQTGLVWQRQIVALTARTEPRRIPRSSTLRRGDP